MSPTEPPNLRFDFIQRLGASVKGANAVVLQDCIGLHLEHHNDLQTWNLITWWTKHTLRSITIPTGRLVRIAMKFGTWIYLKTLDIWYELIWYIYIYMHDMHIYFSSTPSPWPFVSVSSKFIFDPYLEPWSPTTWDSKGPWVSKNCGRSMKPRWKLVAKKVPVMQPSVLSSTTSRLDISGGKDGKGCPYAWWFKDITW